MKLYQKFTHPNMAVDPGPVTQADVDAFKGGIDPLAAAGKLGPLLVQFPSSFQRTPEAVDYLAWLLKAFAGYPLAVELRHRSWSDARRDRAAARRAPRRVGADRRAEVPVVDSPGSEGPATPTCITCACTAATRRSGGTTPSPKIATTISIRPRSCSRSPTRCATCARLVKKAYLFLNNHFSAQSVANAVTLKKMLDEPITARMPAELVERFPDLAGIVATLPRARLL